MVANIALNPTAKDRFAAKYEVSDNGCWEWTAFKNPNGYGMFSPGYGVTSRLAHRVSYFMATGLNPNADLDHLCRNTSCVNPDHLEPVTHKENMLRGISPTAVNAKKTHCNRGHEYAVVGTWASRESGKQCKACRAITDKGRLKMVCKNEHRLSQTGWIKHLSKRYCYPCLKARNWKYRGENK